MIAVPRGGAWFAAIVVDHHRDKGGCCPVLEALEWRGTEPPKPKDLRGRRASGSVHGCLHREVLDVWTRDPVAGTCTESSRERCVVRVRGCGAAAQYTYVEGDHWMPCHTSEQSWPHCDVEPGGDGP